MALDRIKFNIASFNDADAGGNNYYAGIVYEVFNSNDTLADIYSDAAGANQINQDGISNKSNAIGEVIFYIDSGSYYINVGVNKESFTIIPTNDSISDLTLPYVFDTVADMASSAITFPEGKLIIVKERANGLFVFFTTGTADGFGKLDAGNSNVATLYKMITGTGNVTAEEVGKTTPDSVRFYLSNIDTPPNIEYGSTEQINGTESTHTIEDQANFAGQTLGSSAPIGWIHHHYTDGIMHQYDNVGSGTNLFLKNAQNPGRRPDKDPSYVGDGKFISVGTEGFVGAGSERLFLSKDAEWVYKNRQPAVWRSDLDPADGDGFAYTYSCYREMELVAKWSSGGTDLCYVRKTTSDQPQLRLFKSGVFGTDGLLLDLNTANDGVVRILTGPNRSEIAAGAGDLKLSPSLDANAVVRVDGAMKLKPIPAASLPTLTATDRALSWDSTADSLVKWNGSAWVAV